MAKVADLTIKHVISPVITNISTSVTEVVSEDATEKGESILQVVSSETKVIFFIQPPSHLCLARELKEMCKETKMGNYFGLNFNCQLGCGALVFVLNIIRLKLYEKGSF